MAPATAGPTTRARIGKETNALAQTAARVSRLVTNRHLELRRACRSDAGNSKFYCVVKRLCLNLGLHFARALMADAPERARHTVGRLGTIITCAAVLALLAPPRLLGLPNQPEHGAGLQATVPLAASETRKFQLGPGEHKNFLYEAVAQAAISISFVQTERCSA